MSRPRPLGALVILLALLTTLPCSRAHGAPWAGVYATVLTPWCDHGLDTSALERELRYQVHGGVHGLLVLDTLGEGEYTTRDERGEVIAAALRVAAGKVPVVVSVHSCQLDEAAEQVMQAKELGASAVLVEYRGNPRAAAPQVLWFYTALDSLHALPLFYEHAPATTGLRLSSSEVAAIVQLPGMVGIREAGPSDLDATVRALNKAVFTSSALSLSQTIEHGGQGAMCPEAALLPGPTVQLYTACARGRRAEARAVQKELYATAPLTGVRPAPPTVMRVAWVVAEPVATAHAEAPLKAALNDLGVPMSSSVRCPAPPLTEHEKQSIAKEVNGLKAIDWDEASYRAPAEASPAAAERPGRLLRTGAIQLGPWVGRNGWRWQWDGEGGF